MRHCLQIFLCGTIHAFVPSPCCRCRAVVVPPSCMPSSHAMCHDPPCRRCAAVVPPSPSYRRAAVMPPSCRPATAVYRRCASCCRRVPPSCRPADVVPTRGRGVVPLSCLHRFVSSTCAIIGPSTRVAVQSNLQKEHMCGRCCAGALLCPCAVVVPVLCRRAVIPTALTADKPNVSVLTELLEGSRDTFDTRLSAPVVITCTKVVNHYVTKKWDNYVSLITLTAVSVSSFKRGGHDALGRAAASRKLALPTRH